MSATCPSCGVAVVPGYVRCPKCQKPLPAVRKTRAQGAGGTALETGASFPVVPVVVGLAVIGGIIAFVVTRGDDKKEAAPPQAADVTQPQPTAGTTESTQTTTTIAAPTVAPSAPDPAEVAAIIDRDLKKQRLWGTVEVVGVRIDVRSGGCEDPAMAPLLDGQMQALRGAGLTKLRCLEQSGRVVFERDL